MERAILPTLRQKNDLILRFATVNNKSKQLILSHVPCDPDDNDFPIPGFKRTRFPGRICFAVTIKKAQGQSFSGALEIDLEHESFIHG